ncbi:YsnF/AvaK domain-containing protein [Spirosoma endophyticum]|uniref:Conserved domain-containing protein n=1 Tax=Spirosoma endophyticum TaxID=662367 RepID=A0A1I2CXV7_9BACT|nr:YsnF/AvaK domain-containing protein [Spirosoma endophyticum]SFE73116.1 conserved domain-containing protein [Spirosoma endophyticum]
MAQQTVVGFFDSSTEAQNAVDELVNEGFSRTNIDLSTNNVSDTSSSDAYSTDSTLGIPDRHVNTSGTKTEEVVDDVKDTGDSIGGFFKSLFGADDDDDEYKKHTEVGRRSTIVTVHAQSEDEAKQAADILDDNGAVDVDERATQYGYGSATARPDTITGSGDAYVGTTNPDLTADTDQTIKVIEENLEVGKREVETGGVRIRSRIIERPVEESLRLREERVTVQRTPVNRVATDADLNAFQEGQIELTEHAEVPVVSKTARVVEEISVGKEVNERVETIRDTVRSTNVDVENLGTTGTTTEPAVTTGWRNEEDDLNTTSSNR